jgi:hypothetical protein
MCAQCHIVHYLQLRIMGLYVFLSLPADPQEVLNKQHLVYCMHVMSVGCTGIKL